MVLRTDHTPTGGSNWESCAMDESLTPRRRVKDEGLWVVNFFCQDREVLENKHRLTTCQQQRYYVGCKRYPDLLGVKGPQAFQQVNLQRPGLNLGKGSDTAGIGELRGYWNYSCRGEIR